MKAEKTILDEQSQIEAALLQLPKLWKQLPDALKPLARLAPPAGLRADVSLRSANGRQKKRNAPAASWTPDSGVIEISYRVGTHEETQATEQATDTMARTEPEPKSAAPARAAIDPAHDVVLTLAKAELDPKLGFVSLKWFRDSYLPQQGHSWAAVPDQRERVLVNAIERKWILTSKVENPKNPQFPVTAIQLNRPLAEVRAILDSDPGFRSTFNPIVMTGEPLSETVLRERR